jgi:hypothetical protein
MYTAKARNGAHPRRDWQLLSYILREIIESARVRFGNCHLCHSAQIQSLTIFCRHQGVRCPMRRINAALRPLSALLLSVLVFQGCNSLNPLCGSARPAPVITSLSPSTVTLAEVQQGFLLTVNGSQFVASSVVVINGTTVSTLATSSQQLQATVTSAVISAAGTASVKVNTPSGNSGDVGCTSGGTSQSLTLTIT